MAKIKVLTIFGTRPEAIKMAPLILEMNKREEQIESVVAITAQHREMLDQVLSIFDIQPKYDLNIMKKNQTLSDITGNVLSGIDNILKKEKPDIVLVHGDTTTTFSAGLAAFYNQISIGHVEAGLRTWDKYSPFPEEMNRQVTDILSDFYFAPTLQSLNNLQKENHDLDKVYITGNTAIDALKYTVRKDYHHEVLNKIKDGNRIVLVTMHRRENQGQPINNVFKAILKVVKEQKDVEVVFPVHLNPVVQEAASSILGNHPRIHLIRPLEVVDFHNIAAKSYFIMSDSGGVQEEAPSLGVPVLVLRDTTERPEGVKAGTLKLVGTDENNVYKEMSLLLNDKSLRENMAKTKNPYGDGESSRRIVEAILYEFGIQNDKPDQFDL